ncbi:claudin domain-containing protein 1a isoform X2 [Pimephales promelas]|uniref:claudin domain-containing protein 1a isoform X2 n=1 Tax=Pimephales promelas TaxID=90988 RepID=UPI00195599AC|nr:claudin domain-containing protein 1a isoform X2 [Pimephales promelas]KAG1926972.1 claudin domain-containing protein 1 isoform a [Pimephales promelas]
MVDNRHATALVLAGVLSVLASVYLSVSVGSPHWYQYTSPPVRAEPNASELRALQDEFLDGEFDEKSASDAMFRMNGTLGLWWRCVLTPTDAHWYREPDPKMVMECVSFTLSQQFMPKYKEPGNHNSGEDLIRTCVCSLATVCCFLAGTDLLHRVSVLPDRVDGSLGWSLYLALVASPLHMMAAGLLMWAARSHSQSYDRMTVYRVA